MDGTGYGDDGTIWGGEFLEVTVEGYKRLGHLRTIPLPGGTMAVKEPWRMGAAYLERIYGDLEGLPIPFVEGIDPARWSHIRQAMKAQINSPLCSSMGRLFDAASALLGVRKVVNYEGQAAIELEQLAEEGEMGEYPHEISDEKGRLVVNPDPIIEGLIEDIGQGESPSVISARFHNSIAQVILRMVKRIRGVTGLSDIFLTGGVFQNHVLLGRVWDLLEGDGFSVYTQEKVPANDGGISLGQAFYGLHFQGDEICA
jgi:hydrogenase maturation protein HypF